MEISQILNIQNEPRKGKYGRRLIRTLSCFPICWLFLILMCGLMKAPYLVRYLLFALMVIYIYLGSMFWMGTVIYLSTKKWITKKEMVIQVLIVTFGITLSIIAISHDILSVGIKYMD